MDKQPFVASAALVSGLHLMNSSPDVVKRWQNEVTQAPNHRSYSAATRTQHSGAAAVVGGGEGGRLAPWTHATDITEVTAARLTATGTYHSLSPQHSTQLHLPQSVASGLQQ